MIPTTTSNKVRTAGLCQLAIRGRQETPEVSVTIQDGSADPLLHTERLVTDDSRLFPPMRIVVLREEAR